MSPCISHAGVVAHNQADNCGAFGPSRSVYGLILDAWVTYMGTGQVPLLASDPRLLHHRPLGGPNLLLGRSQALVVGMVPAQVGLLQVPPLPAGHESGSPPTY